MNANEREFRGDVFYRIIRMNGIGGNVLYESVIAYSFAKRKHTCV